MTGSRCPLRLATAIFCVVTAAANPTAAQTVTATTGAVNGTVTDSTGAIVPGVTVRLAGPSSMAVRSTATEASGEYRFPVVPPGDYALTFVLVGFTRIVRDSVRVGVGATVSVDVELTPGGVDDSITVTGAPVLDLASTGVTTHFDSQKLAELPGARDIFAVLANTPGVAMVRPEVGGNGALAIQDYTAYGLRASITGVNRNEVEGIRVGGANGANDNYFSDFASFAEIAVRAVGHSAAMPVPGTLTQYVSKSGGNAYRGSLYADVQDGAWQASNIDDEQLARGVTGGPGLDARDSNRLEAFRDFTADAGGYVTKDRAWWYGAFRSSGVRQRYPWLLDQPVTLTANVVTAKLTYGLSPRQRLVGYLQHQRFDQPNFFSANMSQPFQQGEALPRLRFPINVWKAEYTAAVSDAIFGEIRVGAYLSKALQSSKGEAPRVADTGANTLRGASFAGERLISRPQVNGSLSVMKAGWWGHHTFRLGGEYMLDRVDAPFVGYGHPCNCISTLNNDVPTQVQVFMGPNTSSNDLETMAGFLDDTWRVHRRVTLSLGVRLDRYQPILPAQSGPAGQAFAAVDPVFTFSNWGPRAGVSTDLTGDGRTLLKVHYGKFWIYPGANFTAAFNPNPSGWSETRRWLSDPNRNGQWDAGEEGPLIATAGGSASTRLDPDIVNTQVHQATAYVERELASEFGLRTGFVLNARREPYGTINMNRPLSAFSVPVLVTDPGPDGVPGSADDGASVTAYGVTPDVLTRSPLNQTTNLPDSDSDYYTWEVTATRRHRAGWSLLASFTRTWHREAALGAGNDFTPNALINATGGQLRFTTWQAKAHATVSLPLDFRLVPVFRAQSGTPFARTFTRTLNYGAATIRAESVAANRTRDIALIDVRTEKMFRVARVRIIGFFDVYNVFNTNAEQALTTTSGASWLRPTVITGPRILRIGARLDWE